MLNTGSGEREEPKWLQAVNLNTIETENGELVGILGFVTDDGQDEYLIGRRGVQSIIDALNDFIDESEGRLGR